MCRGPQASSSATDASDSSSLSKKSSNNHARNIAIGNALNWLVLVAAVAYAATVIVYTQPNHDADSNSNNNSSSIVIALDEAWKQDGFCIHNMDVAYWSSFDTCLYVDVLFSAILGILYWQWRKLPGMQVGSDIVPMVILGTVGHGLAHGHMGAKFRDGSYRQELAEYGDEVEIPPLSRLLLFAAVFWFPLLQASMPKVKSGIVAFMAILVTFGPIWAGGFKRQLGFAYVQTVLSIAFHVSQLALSEKEKQQREYMTLPLVAIPPVIMAWSEALFCSAFFRDAGGHVLYDASIIVSYVIFYVDCYRFHVLSKSSSSSSMNGGKQKTS